MDYEVALQHLLEGLGKDHHLYAEALILQSRLLENIRQERLYGATETTRVERSRLVSALNQLALNALGTSINDLAMGSRTATPRLTDLQVFISESYALIKEYEDVIRSTSEPKEMVRARRAVLKQQELVRKYLSEYINLANELSVSIPKDIEQIAEYFGGIKPEESDVDIIAIRDLLLQTFTESDLRLLCFDLGIDYDDVYGSTTHQKVIALLDYLKRRARIDELVSYLQRQRPGIL
jgi:hypothetical protein